MRILYNSKDPVFKEPFGTLVPGQPCRIRIHIPRSCMTRETQLVFTCENGDPFTSFAMQPCGGDGDYDFFETTFSLSDPGLYFYYFRITTENEAFSLFREGYDQTNMEAGELWQLSCIPASFKVPRWFAGKVMYQIFPDRFYRERVLPAEGKLAPYWIHENTADIPEYLPDEYGEVKNCDFFGGNLEGITKKLDYLSDLGVSVIYLNPIFKAYSNHRYDTADYLKIDELLGDEADFTRLCEQAHARGMKIILDGVFSHTGSISRYFDVRGEFGNGAYHDPDSPYRSWFQFEEYPEKYTSWWGIKTLPCVEEMDENYRRFIIDGEDSVIAHWLAAGADGFRLDVADELPDEFIALFRARLKELDPDALLIGEVWEDASNKISYDIRRRYFTGGELDSVMNYPFRNAIIDYVCGKDGGLALRSAVMDLAENYPQQVLPTLMNMLSTHDTYRLLSALSPAELPADKREHAGYRMPPEARETAQQRFACAVFLNFVLPGMPCIFYGDEIGTEGLEDPFCRSYFDWTQVNEDNPFLTFTREMAAIRNRESALQIGSANVRSDGSGRVVIERKDTGSLLRAVINIGEELPLDVRGEVLYSKRCTLHKGEAVLEKYGFFLEKRENQ